MKKISFLLVIVVVFCLSGCGKKEQDSELTIQQKEIYQLALNVGYDGTFEEWLASIKGEQGIPGKNVELSVSDGYIKWRNTGDSNWYQLVSLEQLVGPKGQDGLPGKDGVDGKDGKDGLTPFIGENGNWWIGDIDTGVFAGYKNPSVPMTGNFEFAANTDGKSYYVSKYNGNDRLVYIPDQFNGYPVTSIGSNAFYNNSAIEKIIVPKTIETIYSSAFSGVKNLREIEFEEDSNLISIGENALLGCKNLLNISIPNSVISIGDGAFSGCSSLQSITLPFTGQSLTSTGTNAYFGYIFGASNYTGSYNANGYYIPNNLKEVIITDATSIGNSAFSGCSSLTSITIPNSVTSIGNYAFNGCSSLTSITIPNSVTSIGNYAFNGCSSLQSITLPFLGQSRTSTGTNAYFGYIFGSSNYIGSYNANGYYIPNNLKEVIITDATSIGAFAFDGCSSLTSITIPDSVTSIGAFAFDGCSSLTSITIPDSVTSIASYAFYGCSSLQSITLPFVGQSRTSTGTNAFFGYIFGTSNYTGSYKANGYYIPNNLKEVIITDATSIGSSAFYGCSSLTSITIPNSVTSIGDAAFQVCSSLTSIIIPDSVTSIGTAAFWYCSSLTSITIPNSVTSIGNSAFCGCSSLTSITIPDSVTSIGHEAFNGCSSLTSIIIPDSVTSIGSYAFRDCSKLTIYVEALSKPSGWDSTWNYSIRPVVWGYNG